MTETDATQALLPLDAPPLPDTVPLLPARMVNEYAYCPRLAYLEWVQGEWAESADTVEGRTAHRRVDKPGGRPPRPAKGSAKAGADQPPAAAADDTPAEPDEPRIHVRSLELSSQALGLVAKLDLAEFAGTRAVPVDYKRGKRPHVARGAYEPERIQLCAQALLLEEHGFSAPEGVLYFVASKERVPVVFDDELKAATRAAAAGLRLIATGGQILPPLENSPKCPRCSLAPICLPDEQHCLRIARDLVASKIRNQRTLLRRNWKPAEGEPVAMPDALLSEFRQDIEAAERARSLETLLGIEGNAAARYFRHFNQMISPERRTDHAPSAQAGTEDALWGFDFSRRTRRPPTDAVNALLSYGYSMLSRSVAVTLTAVGFDALRGFYHQSRYGRPALALDMMEPFRPLLADSTVLMVINNGEIGRDDFVRAGGAVNLNERGRRAFIAAFERRLSQEVTHPVFGYAAQYRQILEIQCRLLGRHLLGEIDRVPSFVTR